VLHKATVGWPFAFQDLGNPEIKIIMSVMLFFCPFDIAP
jgi:hypothetical protein